MSFAGTKVLRRRRRVAPLARRAVLLLFTRSRRPTHVLAAPARGERQSQAAVHVPCLSLLLALSLSLSLSLVLEHLRFSTSVSAFVGAACCDQRHRDVVVRVPALDKLGAGKDAEGPTEGAERRGTTPLTRPRPQPPPSPPLLFFFHLPPPPPPTTTGPPPPPHPYRSLRRLKTSSSSSFPLTCPLRPLVEASLLILVVLALVRLNRVPRRALHAQRKRVQRKRLSLFSVLALFPVLSLALSSPFSLSLSLFPELSLSLSLPVLSLLPFSISSTRTRTLESRRRPRLLCAGPATHSGLRVSFVTPAAMHSFTARVAGERLLSTEAALSSAPRFAPVRARGWSELGTGIMLLGSKHDAAGAAKGGRSLHYCRTAG